MTKSIQNANAITCKLGSCLTRIINYRPKIAKKKQHKREKIIKKRKIKAKATKYHKYKEGISLFIEKEESYKDNTKNNINLDQANDKYPLQL